MVSGVTLLGGITLNKTVGGLNPHAVRMAGELGARILWFPTHHAAHHNSTLVEGGRGDDKGIYVLDAEGKLLPEVHEILDLVLRYDMLLGTGHVSFPEASAIVKAAREKGIERIIANHPLSKNSCRYTVAEAKQLADLGATVELTFVSMMPFTRAKTSTPQETVEAIREIGPERCIISTDFGAYATPPPPEGLRMFIATLTEPRHGAGRRGLHGPAQPEAVGRPAVVRRECQAILQKLNNSQVICDKINMEVFHGTTSLGPVSN